MKITKKRSPIRALGLLLGPVFISLAVIGYFFGFDDPEMNSLYWQATALIFGTAMLIYGLTGLDIDPEFSKLRQQKHDRK